MDRLWRTAYRLAFRLQLVYWRVRRPRIVGAYVAVWRGGELLCIRNTYRRSYSLPAGGRLREARGSWREEISRTRRSRAARASLAWRFAWPA